MAHETGKVLAPAWRAPEESRQAFLAWLVSVGDVELAEFYRRHPAQMEGAVWSYIRGDRIRPPSVCDVLELARAVAERELVRFAGVEPAGALVSMGSLEADPDACDVWWRERIACLSRIDAKAYVASCESALEGRRGVFVFSSEAGDG